MIRLHIPDVTQDDFDDAFAVLRECRVQTLPCLGFSRPFMGPGGQYGACWWERDSALTLSGSQWVDRKEAEQCLYNFADVQKENGRIPLYGYDRVSDFDPELSAIPVLFEVAWKLVKRSTDRRLWTDVYDMLSKYMNWWLSPLKRDARTGLVAGIFEESDPSDVHDQLTAVQVDLNVQIAVGADCLADLARRLGRPTEAAHWQTVFSGISDAINRHLYDPVSGGYYTRLLTEDRLQTERVYNAMFDTFKRGIVPVERRAALLALLKHPDTFGYDSPLGLTTMAKNCGQYTETVGVYQGYTSWSGNIWTLRNEIIVTGLRESGLREEAAHLAWQTIRTFNRNYAEFISPSTGIGHGVARYGWSAAQYIQMIIEELFGVDFDASAGRVTVCPNIPLELTDRELTLEGLPLYDERTLDIRAIRRACGTEVAYHISDKA